MITLNKRFFYLFFLVTNILQLLSQTTTSIPFKKQAYSDAAGAIEITDSIYGPTNVGEGIGHVNEYDVNKQFVHSGKMSFTRENNSAWFKLGFDHDTLLTFDLVPIDPADDYDFIFFKCQDANCFTRLKNSHQPDRECHSGFDSYNGATGLSREAATPLVGAGPGPTYASAIRVKKGEVFYLSVFYADHYTKDGRIPKGFTLYFHDYWPKKKPVVLKNVNFKTNDATLLKESYAELDRLVETLTNEKAMNIEIKGHTDNQGGEAKNLELSSRRAKAVKDYLVSKGISPKRVQSRGYGSSRPLATNATEAGRRKNRRVEFSLIMK